MNVLFVCTGNVCRSPIAEALMRKKFEKYDLDGIVDSAGFSPTTINDVRITEQSRQQKVLM